MPSSFRWHNLSTNAVERAAQWLDSGKSFLPALVLDKFAATNDEGSECTISKRFGRGFLGGHWTITRIFVSHRASQEPSIVIDTSPV